MKRHAESAYDPPMLQEIGTADQVILGVGLVGHDLDGSLVATDFEWSGD